MDNIFSKLYSINVNEHVEKKGQFSYLSWPYAVAQLRLADPAAAWEVRRFDGLPYLSTDLGVFVEVAVTVNGVTLSQIHPVLDGKNRPLLMPTAFDINTSIQRCLVKAIALHGLGLYIYAGEDLPAVLLGSDEAENAEKTQKPRLVATGSGASLNEAQIRQVCRLIEEVNADTPRLLAFFGVERIEDIPASQFDRVVRSLEKGKRKAA